MVDSAAMSGLKERYDGCDELLGSSPLLLLSISNAPQKPLTLTVSNPSGGGKKPKSGATSLPPADVTFTAAGNRPAQPFGHRQGTIHDITATHTSSRAATTTRVLESKNYSSIFYYSSTR